VAVFVADIGQTIAKQQYWSRWANFCDFHIHYFPIVSKNGRLKSLAGPLNCLVQNVNSAAICADSKSALHRSLATYNLESKRIQVNNCALPALDTVGKVTITLRAGHADRGVSVRID
jgi:hypothetical protein